MVSAQTVLACSTCGQVQQVEILEPGMALECCRCGAVIGERRRRSLATPAALALAALILYVPANLYPILRMEWYGAYTENTVWDGVVSLAKSHQWFVAVVVFVASIVIPLVKLAALFFLTITTRFGTRRWLRARTRIYRF